MDSQVNDPSTLVVGLMQELGEPVIVQAHPLVEAKLLRDVEHGSIRGLEVEISNLRAKRSAETTRAR